MILHARMIVVDESFDLTLNSKSCSDLAIVLATFTRVAVDEASQVGHWAERATVCCAAHITYGPFS